jgi:hypothetical protein
MRDRVYVDTLVERTKATTTTELGSCLGDLESRSAGIPMIPHDQILIAKLGQLHGSPNEIFLNIIYQI